MQKSKRRHSHWIRSQTIKRWMTATPGSQTGVLVVERGVMRRRSRGSVTLPDLDFDHCGLEPLLALEIEYHRTRNCQH